MAKGPNNSESLGPIARLSAPSAVARKLESLGGRPTPLVSRQITVFWLSAAAISLLVAWPLLAGRVPAFRDGLHFYYPFATWLHDQPSILPKWNQADGVGTNVIGEMSSALFYPGRVLMWLPGMSIAQRIGIFTLAHVWLASLTMFYAARQSDCSREATSLAAVSYALCCPVLFQHTNVIYLVSAAWLPIILAQCIRLVRDCQPNWLLWVISASMMLLGGDPQATLGAGLVTGLVIGLITGQTLLSRPLRHSNGRSCVTQCSKFVVCIGIVASLTAVQWIPTWYWLQHSSRALGDRNLHASSSPASPDRSTSMETTGSSLPQLLESLATAGDVALPAVSNRYAFSTAPWHLLTMVWGTSAGHFAPENSRWLSALRAEPRMWIPSLSIGLLPLLLCTLVWAHWRSVDPTQRRKIQWLTLIALLALLAMLGNYTPLWAARQVARWFQLDVSGWPSDEVGGLTWLLTQSVPGYAALRYPAKWSVWFAGSLSLISAHGLDILISACHAQHASDQRPSWAVAWLSRSAALLATLTLLWLAGLAMLVWLPSWRFHTERWLHPSVDAWHGSVQSSAAAIALASSLAMTLGIAMALFVACRMTQRGLKSQRTVAWLPMVILWLSLVELGGMTRSWLVTAPIPSTPPSLESPMDNGNEGTTSNVRIWSAIGRADFAAWHESTRLPSSEYQSIFQLGKLHLRTAGVLNVTALGTLTPQALVRVRSRIAQADDMRVEQPAVDEALAWLGVTHRLVDSAHPRWQSVPNPRPMIELASQAAGSLQVVSRSDDRWILQVDIDRPSHLDLRWFQDGGWRATLTHTSDGRILHAVPHQVDLNLFQRMPIPEGKWTIDLHYQTPGLQLGAWITCISLLLFVVWCLKNVGLWRYV